MKNIFIVCMYLFGCSAYAETSWEKLTQDLTKQRSEVEVLSQDIDSIQSFKQSELNQLIMQKNELEAQIEKENLRQIQFDEKLKRLELKVKQSEKIDPNAYEKVVKWVTGFQSIVQASVPFEHQSRLTALTDILDRLDKKREPLELVLSDFWIFVENEIKLAHTNEYKIVNAKIKDTDEQVEVARLGLAQLYAVTTEGKAYKATAVGDKWSWALIEDTKIRSSVLHLVKNLKNKVDTGIYTLPVSI